MEELRNSSKDYGNYLRMSEDNVMSLLEKVRPLIEKEDTVLRTAITAEEWFSAIISQQALGKILLETCRAIY
jgi:hypothetical protein